MVQDLTAARTLTNFFLAKLDDFDSLSPSLSALLVLSKLSATTFDDDTAVEVYRQYVVVLDKRYLDKISHIHTGLSRTST